MPKDFFIETGLVFARVFKSTGFVLRCGPVDPGAMNITLYNVFMLCHCIGYAAECIL